MIDDNIHNTGLSNETQDALKKTFFECSIVFNLCTKEEFGELKSNMFLQTVIALMVNAETACDAEQIADSYYNQTGRRIATEQFEKALIQLKKMGAVTPHNDVFVPHGNLTTAFRTGVDDVKKMYARLVQGLIDRWKEIHMGDLSEKQIGQAQLNIKEAFNLYARLHGMDSLIENGSTLDDADEDEDIIKYVKSNLDDDMGNELVEVMADTLARPTEFQSKVLNLLMQSFIGAQIMQIDPLLGQLESEHLKAKTFVFDTDFVLNSLTKYHSQSQNYRKLIKALRKIGCTIIIPSEVVEEVVRHLQCAERNNSWFARTFESIDPENVEREATNVFVKDYYMWKFRTHKKDFLRKFLRDRYYDASLPNAFIRRLIKDELHLDIMGDALELSQSAEGSMEQLTKLIKQEIQASFKNKWRDDSETESLAKTDALLYLYTKSLNQDSVENSQKELLNARAYIITYTTKSIRCAKAMGIHEDIVTRPEILINLLQRIGAFETNDKNQLNLFDNPFLTYIMRQNWQRVKILAELGVDLHGCTLTRLSFDLDEALHEFLTSDAEKDEIPTYEMFLLQQNQPTDKFFQLADIIKQKRYGFVPIVNDLLSEYKANKKQLHEAEVAKVKAEAKLAQKVAGYKHYLEKMENPKLKKTKLKGKYRRRK